MRRWRLSLGNPTSPTCLNINVRARTKPLVISMLIRRSNHLPSINSGDTTTVASPHGTSRPPAVTQIGTLLLAMLALTSEAAAQFDVRWMNLLVGDWFIAGEWSNDVPRINRTA